MPISCCAVGCANPYSKESNVTLHRCPEDKGGLISPLLTILMTTVFANRDVRSCDDIRTYVIMKVVYRIVRNRMFTT